MRSPAPPPPGPQSIPREVPRCLTKTAGHRPRRHRARPAAGPGSEPRPARAAATPPGHPGARVRRPGPDPATATGATARAGPARARPAGSDRAGARAAAAPGRAAAPPGIGVIGGRGRPIRSHGRRKSRLPAWALVIVVLGLVAVGAGLRFVPGAPFSKHPPTAAGPSQPPLPLHPANITLDSVTTTGFLSWAVLDRRTGEIFGSSNMDATRPRRL